MRRKKVTATKSLTRVVSKINDVPVINGICTLCGCKKHRLKKGSYEQKPWIKGSNICTGKSSVENKLLELYYSNFSGIDDLHRKLKEDGFTVSKTKIKEVL